MATETLDTSMDFSEFPEATIDSAQDFSAFPEVQAPVSTTPASRAMATSNGHYSRPENAPALKGIHPDVFGQVMSEEGPEFAPDGGHPSVFGMWGDKPGVEQKAYETALKNGPTSLEAYNAVTSGWLKSFLPQSEPWKLVNPGMQMLVISDSQHRGGASARAIINQMGGIDVVNAMDPGEAINTYSELRRPLWPTKSNVLPDRVDRERQWALTNGQILNDWVQFPITSPESVPSPSRDPEKDFSEFPVVSTQSNISQSTTSIPNPASITAQKENPVVATGQQIAGSVGEAAAATMKGEARSQLERPAMPPIFPEPPDVTAARAERDKAYAQQQLTEADQLKAASEGIKPSRQFQESIPGQIAGTIGGTGYTVAAASMGGPLMLATTVAAQAHTQAYDQAKANGANDETAKQLADKSAHIAAMTAVALSAAGLQEIPVQNIVARVAARAAFGGTVQGIAAGVAQELSNDEFTKAGMPPAGGPNAGVPEAMGGGFALGAFSEGLHGLTERPPGRVQAPEGIKTPPEVTTAPEQAAAPPPEAITAKAEDFESFPEAEVPPPPVSTEPETSQAEAEVAARNEKLYQDLQKEVTSAKQKPQEPAPEVPAAPVQEGTQPVETQKQGAQAGEIPPIKEPYDRFRYLHHLWSITDPSERGPEPVWQEGESYYAGLPLPKLTAKQTEALRQTGVTIAGIAKASQDFMRDYPETEALGLALRREPSYEQDIASRAAVPALTRYLDKVKGTVRQQVIDEYTAYFRALDAKQPLPVASPEAQTAINLAKQTLLVLGTEAKNLGVKVRMSNGQWRDFRMLGDRFVPRGMLTADMQDILDNRNGTRAADYQALVAKYPQLANRDLSTHDRTSNATFVNLEKAREAKLPLGFYDYSPYATLRYINRATRRLAQIRAYGQGVNNVPELFDRAVEAIADSPRPKAERDFIIGRIRSAQNAEYNNYDRGGFQSPIRGATQITTAAMVGNPLSSAKYLVTGTLQNLHYGGSANFARAIGHLVQLRGRAYEQAENLGILRNVLSNTMRSYDDKEPQWGNWTAQQMLHYMGHNAADSTNRTIGMLIAYDKLGEFVRAWNNGQRKTFLGDFIQRRGISDLAALAAERGQGPLSDEFVRQFALDVHGSYGLGQMPSWMGNPQSRFFMQFMRWGINASRLANQEHTMPLLKAVTARDPGAIGYQFLRGLGFIAAGIASGEITNLFRSLMTGRDPNDPTLKEIGYAILRGNYENALAWGFKREMDMMILGGFTGTLGEYYGQAGNVVTQPGQMGAKNPMHPPGYDLLTNGLAFIQGWYGENHLLGLPSQKLLVNLLDNISAVRVARQIGSNIAARAGIPVPGAAEYAARNTLAWVREREDMFVHADPVFAQKLAQAGNRASQSSGRTPLDPWKDRIQGALLTGNAAEANKATREYLAQFPSAERQKELKHLQDSVRQSQPLKPGGSISQTAQSALMKWANNNLPPDEVTRMKALARTYARTANATGYFALHSQ